MEQRIGTLRWWQMDWISVIECFPSIYFVYDQSGCQHLASLNMQIYTLEKNI